VTDCSTSRPASTRLASRKGEDPLALRALTLKALVRAGPDWPRAQKSRSHDYTSQTEPREMFRNNRLALAGHGFEVFCFRFRIRRYGSRSVRGPEPPQHNSDGGPGAPRAPPQCTVHCSARQTGATPNVTSPQPPSFPQPRATAQERVTMSNPFCSELLARPREARGRDELRERSPRRGRDSGRWRYGAPVSRTGRRLGNSTRQTKLRSTENARE
jgi:hypothetical protein